MKKKMNEGIRKVQCYEFSDFLHRNFYYIQKGKKRTADVVKEYLESIGEPNNKNAFDQLLKYAKAEVIKMQQASERSREGDWDSFLWESKKIKLSESELKSIIKESIEEIMTGGYINQDIDNKQYVKEKQKQNVLNGLKVDIHNLRTDIDFLLSSDFTLDDNLRNYLTRIKEVL